MRERGGKGKVIDDIEQGDCHNRRDIEPERDVKAWLIAFGKGPEEVDTEDHPDNGDGDIDGPDQLGVFLATGETGRQCDGCRNNDQLPTPEVDAG